MKVAITILFSWLWCICCCQEQYFEGQVTYKVFERFDDPDEIVPEDSIVLFIADSMFLEQIYIDGKVWRWSLLRNDTLFESKSSTKVVYKLLEKQSEDYQWVGSKGNQVQTNKKGSILEDNLGNTYFALFDSTILVDFCIYPIYANNLSYLPKYLHLNKENASYTHQIKSKKAQILNANIFQIPSHYRVISEKDDQEELIRQLKSQPPRGNVLLKAKD